MSKLATVVERPLSNGMQTNFAGQVLPPGAFVDVSNLYSTERGLYRFPDYALSMLGEQFDSPLLQEPYARLLHDFKSGSMQLFTVFRGKPLQHRRSP